MINLLNTPMTSFCQVSTLEMKIFRGYIFPRETRKKQRSLMLDKTHRNTEMGWKYSEEEGQKVVQTLHIMITKTRKELKRARQQRMARCHYKEEDTRWGKAN